MLVTATCAVVGIPLVAVACTAAGGVFPALVTVTCTVVGNLVCVGLLVAVMCTAVGGSITR